MLLEEFDVEKYERTFRSEGREEGMEIGIEQGIRCMVEVLPETGQARADILDKLVEKYAMSREEAKFLLYRK